MLDKFIIAATLFMLFACGEGETQDDKISGGEKTGKTRTLETGSAVLQSKDPLNAMNIYLDGFHFMSGDMSRQMEAHHYCTKINEDFTQCIIYDGNTKEARLIGVEYIISERKFKSLSAEEKALWHSHHYEVKSGTLIAPGLPQLSEHELMEEIVSTYGKTWHTWDTHSNKDIPLGIPHLMMGLTMDGQMSPSLLNARDKRFEVSAAEKKSNRQDIPLPAVDPGANAWEKGNIIQIKQEKRLKNKTGI